MSAPTILRLTLLGAVALALEAACRLGAISPLVIIPPSEMVRAMGGLLLTEKVRSDLVFTLTIVATSSVVSIVLGGVIGLAVHAVPPLRRIVDPLLSAYYAIPNFVFYPLFIVMFGLGAPALVALAVTLAIGAMVIATIDGLDSVRPILRRTAKAYRLSPLREIRSIRVPAALPHLVTGVKLVIAYAFIGEIAGEFILSDQGLGHAIAFAYDNFDNREMYGLIALVVLIVTTINGLVRLYERRQFAARGLLP